MHRPQDGGLDFDGDGIVLLLFEDFDDALAAFELGLGFGVEIGAELGEGGQFAVLGEVELDAAGDLFHGLELGGGTDARNGKSDGNGRADALIEEVGFQINLAVGDGDDVGWNVGGDVAGLRLNDGQGGEGTVAVFFANAGGAFEQAAVQIENVAGIGFAAGGAFEHEGNLAISDGVLGKVVKYNEGVHGVVHEPFAHGRAGKGG